MKHLVHVKSAYALRLASVARKVDLQSLVVGEGNPRGGDTVTLVVGQDFDASTSLYAARRETSVGGQLIEWQSGISYPTAE
jgi:hypothetical protein